MKKFGAVIFLLFSLTVYSQDKQANELLLTGDSIYSLQNNWKFSVGDDSSMALPSYNDSAWKKSGTALRITDTTEKPFNGIGWFRLYFTTDSTTSGKPLAITMEHYGAS